MTNLFIKIFHLKYRYIFRPIIFKFDSEKVHEFFVWLGIKLGKYKFIKSIIAFFFASPKPTIQKEILGINFTSPIGLAAGFDYEGQLTQILPSLGFGFMTIGTVTNLPYEGNTRPRLGRLIKSRGLLVNKGFKNSGIDNVLNRLKNLDFKIPVGISIGPTNISAINTVENAIQDIITAFQKTVESQIPFAYYELNISCPNLSGCVSFYPLENLRELLSRITSLKLQKPLFIKMPIERTNEETLEMLEVIKDFPVDGVIFGNLQKDRTHKTIIQSEINKYPKGYASGKPTQKRSTELIRLTKENFDDRFIIIGCGGIFSPKDAQEKLNAGTTLLQLITGLIFEGPQLVAEINSNLDPA